MTRIAATIKRLNPFPGRDARDGRAERHAALLQQPLTVDQLSSLRASGPPWLGPIHRRVQVDLFWLVVTGSLLAFGTVFFGWRGLFGAGITTLASLVTYMTFGGALKRWSPDRVADSNLYALNLGLLLAAALPAMERPAMPLLAGVLMGLTGQIVGRSHKVRAHPVVVVWFLMVLFSWTWMPRDSNLASFGAVQSVLRPDRLLIGDLTDLAERIDRQAWWHCVDPDEADAVPRSDPHTVVVMQQRTMLQHRAVLANLLGNGWLRPLGEVLLGVVPGHFGASSRGLLILLGLYLIHRRLAWWPMAAIALLAAGATLLLMPLKHDGHWTLVLLRLWGMGPSVAVTYVSFITLASPLLLVVLILAPQTAPTGYAGRLVYALIIGVTAVLTQWVFATYAGAYLGLLIASILSRRLDALHKSPFIS